MKARSLDDYKKAGCTLAPAVGDETALGILASTNGDMCKGCAAYHDGKCRAYNRLVSGRAVLQKQYSETVREEAARRGISIGEVRRQRASE